MKSGVLLCLWLAASLSSLSCRRNRPPDRPSRPSGPASLWPGATGEFWASSYDPDYQDVVSFQFDWGGGDTSAWTAFSESASVMMHHAWLNPGQYGVRARARDDKNAESNWSESLAVSVAFVGFAPNVSVDQGRSCVSPSIAIGPPTGGYQAVYVAMQDGPNIAFQKSTNAGASWLADNRVVCQGYIPDITTDADGGIHIVYHVSDHVYCVHSFDGGSTWSSPARVDDCDTTFGIGSADVAAGTAGHLFSAWNDGRSGSPHIWSSTSADQGATWNLNFRADDDSSNSGCCERGVYVQPGTNHYFVAADVGDDATVYRSRDMGQTFEPGVQLETGRDYARSACVVADREHVICGYIGGYENGVTRTRTLYTTPDTWGQCKNVTDGSHNSYWVALAMSASGRVHAAQMMNRNDGNYGIYYAYSTDHGATWCAPERIDDDRTEDKCYPDIGADSVGYAYIVWEDWRAGNPGVWFSTNNPASSGGGFRRRDSEQMQPRVKGRTADRHPVSGSLPH